MVVPEQEYHHVQTNYAPNYDTQSYDSRGYQPQIHYNTQAPGPQHGTIEGEVN